MQKIRHSKVSGVVRSGKRSAFLFFLFLLFFEVGPVSVFAGVSQNVVCPSGDVEIVFSYLSDKENVLISTNLESRYFPETPNLTYVYNQVLRGRSVSGIVPLTNNSTALVVVASCSEALPLPLQAVSENFLMGLAGSITAGLFVFALLKSAL